MKHSKSKRAALALLALLGAGIVTGHSLPALAGKQAPAARELSAAKLKALDGYFTGIIAAQTIPGAVALVKQHGRTVYSGVFGMRDSGHAMTADSIFRLYSMSKPITSVAAMMLVDQGKLKLDDPLSKYIPAFANAKVGIDNKTGDEHESFGLVPLDRPITIADLLRHTSGITYGFYGNDPARRRYAQLDIYGHDWSNAGWAERIAQLPLAEQPGTLWDYGHSTDILGRVIEVISGQSLYQFEKAHLFDPLGMKDTSYYVTDPDKRARVAEPFPNDRMIGLVTGMHDPGNVKKWEAGGSGLVSTASDYAHFLQMMLNKGTLDGHRYLKPSTVALMTQDHIGPETGIKRDYYYFPGAGSGFGYGFAVRTKELADEPGPIGEYRWDGVGGTFFWVDPVNDMFVVVMLQSPAQRWAVEVGVRKIVEGALE